MNLSRNQEKRRSMKRFGGPPVMKSSSIKTSSRDMYVYATEWDTKSYRRAIKSVVEHGTSLALLVPITFGNIVIVEGAQMFHEMVTTWETNATFANAIFHRAIHWLRRVNAWFVSFDVCSTGEWFATFLALKRMGRSDREKHGVSLCCLLLALQNSITYFFRRTRWSKGDSSAATLSAKLAGDETDSGVLGAGDTGIGCDEIMGPKRLWAKSSLW